LLDEWLETDFSFIRVEAIAESLALLTARAQGFTLTLIRQLAAGNIEVAHQFARHAPEALSLMNQEQVRAWALVAMDLYDSQGLAPALATIRNPQDFLASARERECGAFLEDCRRILTTFIRGLSGRKLEILEDAEPWTDGEHIYLPRVLALFDDAEANFGLYKAMTAHLWAQTRFGSFRPDLLAAFAGLARPQQATGLYHAFERLRLDACLARDLPGLYRRMQPLQRPWPELADDLAALVQAPEASAFDSLRLALEQYPAEPPEPAPYQGVLKLELVAERQQERIEREKVLIRIRLRELLDELKEEGAELSVEPQFSFRPEPRKQAESTELESGEWLLDGKPIPPPDDLAALTTSVLLDLGQLPEDYLHPAGDGEYDISQYRLAQTQVDDVWAGTYHEEGAFLYDEWDYRRQSYRKHWCVVREHRITPTDTDFYQLTLDRYRPQLAQIRRGFEALRGEDSLQKRQPHGDDVDIDALVDAWGDMHSGLEMSERLFTRWQRDERNIALMLMVDLSGSTRGWINQAEREALVLLAQALEILGDRYAIYGFSGWGRKRCEVFCIKDFGEPLDEEVKGRISAIEAKDYTRMGPAIRHLSALLGQVAARVRLLITLSDGKPDDYDPEYRGQYGIEDTRMALFEARRQGVQAYCVTIDREGRDYLGHMYGAANYSVIQQVEDLPPKLSEIYRRLTR
jgi:nitric oxide reductase NorD protein